MKAENIHLKDRKGPVTDLRRKKSIALHANLMAATAFVPKSARRSHGQGEGK